LWCPEGNGLVNEDLKIIFTLINLRVIGTWSNSEDFAYIQMPAWYSHESCQEMLSVVVRKLVPTTAS
jgi:hypothetical protein